MKNYVIANDNYPGFNRYSGGRVIYMFKNEVDNDAVEAFKDEATEYAGKEYSEHDPSILYHDTIVGTLEDEVSYDELIGKLHAEENLFNFINEVAEHTLFMALVEPKVYFKDDEDYDINEFNDAELYFIELEKDRVDEIKKCIKYFGKDLVLYIREYYFYEDEDDFDEDEDD